MSGGRLQNVNQDWAEAKQADAEPVNTNSILGRLNVKSHYCSWDGLVLLGLIITSTIGIQWVTNKGLGLLSTISGFL